MFKKSLLILSLFGLTVLNAASINEPDCNKKGESFIYAGGECIEYKAYGENGDKLNIVVHGSWSEGTNILGRYAPFAESLAFQTDVKTVAVALPGYSGSSTNDFPSLLNSKGIENLSSNKAYLSFLEDLVSKLKEKYEAGNITYIGHSAGCAMGATMLGLNPELINNLLCAGGSFKKDKEGLISAVDVIDNASKDVKIVLVYGTKDDISKPEKTIDFYNLAKEKGFNVELIKVDGAGHLDLDMTEPSVAAIVKLNEEE